MDIGTENITHCSILPDFRITKHKRFVPYGTHPNFCFVKTYFMRGTLYDINFIN